jgi:hydroxymethylbilane synthase
MLKFAASERAPRKQRVGTESASSRLHRFAFTLLSAFPPPSRLVIASRESRLALWQAEHVKARLEALYPGCEVVIEGMTTRGDQILDRALNKVGGKGLFIKELEQALLSERCDIAVHSLKDVPMTLEPEFELAAMLERGDARDAFVSSIADGMGDLGYGATVGTSSLRREAQLRALRPDLRIAPLRGNVETRLAKLDRGEFQAIILAAAGLQRLGLQHRIRTCLEPEISLPAPGQGVLGIEILARRTDLHAWLAPLHHADSALAARAEREVSRRLGGNCDIPLAAYAEVHAGQLSCRGLIAATDGSRVLRAHDAGDAGDPERIGAHVAKRLLEQGAQRLIGV